MYIKTLSVLLPISNSNRQNSLLYDEMSSNLRDKGEKRKKIRKDSKSHAARSTAISF
ncbi:hypothetical protein PUN28_010960 [Cardiocondyla obscurior]|uniref:Uncharacterized protein n=1 Tax=Cardiocondyla obscurior TaxID=286306 RepID=A0AAW2FPG5_9HYME